MRTGDERCKQFIYRILAQSLLQACSQATKKVQAAMRAKGSVLQAWSLAFVEAVAANYLQGIGPQAGSVHSRNLIPPGPRVEWMASSSEDWSSFARRLPQMLASAREDSVQGGLVSHLVA